jgi:hypothetical protein
MTRSQVLQFENVHSLRFHHKSPPSLQANTRFPFYKGLSRQWAFRLTACRRCESLRDHVKVGKDFGMSRRLPVWNPFQMVAGLRRRASRRYRRRALYQASLLLLHPLSMYLLPLLCLPLLCPHPPSLLQLHPRIRLSQSHTRFCHHPVPPRPRDSQTPSQRRTCKLDKNWKDGTWS